MLHRRTAPWLTAFSLASSLGCGGGTTEAQLDLPDVPAVPANAREIRLPETRIPAAGEQMLCIYLDQEPADVWVHAFRAYQGKLGHHLLLFKTYVPEDPGTVKDCTNPADMAKLLPVVAASNAIGDRLPNGMGVKIGHGTQLVVQQHYVNTTEHEIIARDVGHLITMADTDVQKRVYFLANTDVDFVLPGDNIPHTLQFHCALEFPVNMVLAAPHMHALGAKFKTEYGPSTEAMTTMIDVDRWAPQMRDAPPITEFEIGAAASRLPAGTVIQTSCSYVPVTRDIRFPQEMCATYGYFFADEGDSGADEIACAADDFTLL